MTKAWCIIGADGYAGYAGLYQQGVTEAACMAHVRRKSHPRRDEIASDVGDGRTGAPRGQGGTADRHRGCQPSALSEIDPLSLTGIDPLTYFLRSLSPSVFR